MARVPGVTQASPTRFRRSLSTKFRGLKHKPGQLWPKVSQRWRISAQLGVGREAHTPPSFGDRTPVPGLRPKRGLRALGDQKKRRRKGSIARPPFLLKRV